MDFPIHSQPKISFGTVLTVLFILLIAIILLAVNIKIEDVNYHGGCTELQPDQEQSIRDWGQHLIDNNVRYQSYKLDVLQAISTEVLKSTDISHLSEMATILQMVRETLTGVDCYSSDDPEVIRILNELIDISR